MLDLIWNVVAFLGVIGVLVTFHEAGHFWVARWLGVGVEQFSIGFGPAIFKRVGKENITYQWAAIPLGGYVKMYDRRNENVPEGQEHKAFDTKPLWVRSAVVAAGPLANFILAVVIYALAGMVGVRGVAPIVETPAADSALASYGIEAQDRIVAVNDESVSTWTDVRIALIDLAIDDQTQVDVALRRNDGREYQINLPLDPALLESSDNDPIEQLGFKPWAPKLPPIIGGLAPGGAAEMAGLQANDVVVSLDNQPIESWSDIVSTLRASEGAVLKVVVERNGQAQQFDVKPAVVDGRYMLGIQAKPDPSLYDSLQAKTTYRGLDALSYGVDKTIDMTVLTLGMIKKLIVGEASVKNISGPVTIAQVAGQSAEMGLDYYLGFMALLSVSLAVFNLMPVPVLDGGHLLSYLVEAIRGRPLSERTQGYVQQLGLVVIMMLTFLALFNDFTRFAG